MLLTASVVAASASGATANDPSCRSGGRCVHFVTPDGDIECDISFDATAAGGGGFGSVRCGIHRNRVRAPKGAASSGLAPLLRSATRHSGRSDARIRPYGSGNG